MNQLALLFLLSTLLWLGALEAHAQACDQTCCCKVCSATTMDAFPYGLPVVPNSLNVNNPSVIGATCNVPVWSAYRYNDTHGNPISVPSTLFWTNQSYFGDTEAHVAPTTCSCCQLSVHTSCSEAAPLATRPKTLLLPGGRVITGLSGTFTLAGGVELTNTDRIQLRRDTFCGYNGSTMSIAPPQMVPSADQTEVDVTITMPAAACYSVCYFHSTLTTPTWYLIGTLVVNPAPLPSISFEADPTDVLLGGNTITVTFSGQDLLSPFDDLAELRLTSETCGATTPAPRIRSGAFGADILQVVDGATWCSPKVEARITTTRPLRRIAIQYTDCAPANRIYLSKLKWTFRLPANASDITYKMCYRRNSVWNTAGSLTVLARRSQLIALQSLYSATNGANWLKNYNWGGSNPCLFHGVRCNAMNVVTSIHLGRNRLVGPIPAAFFLSDLAGTLSYLALDMNNITGSIPSAMGAMKVLEFVDFGFNQMVGTLPTQLLGLTKIDVVYISNNQFEGQVPASIDNLSLQWLRNNLTAHVPIVIEPECPTDPLECVDAGSTAAGVFECGYDGITEAECVVMGCCFNAQAPLVFGGSTCFTKRSITFLSYPQCTATNCTTQVVVDQF